MVEGHRLLHQFQCYPMLPEPSRVQHCPECRKYYFLDDIKPTVLEDEMWKEFRIGCSETGSLDYKESREAMNQFAESVLSQDQEEWLHLNLLYAINDWRTRELMVVRKNLRGLKGKDGGWAEGWRESAQKQEAELHREMGDNHLTRQFRAKALAGNTEVFTLHLKDMEN